MFSLFPALAKVARSPAGVLSGGERQMLILGRALVAEPTLLLMDEPFLGLSREVRDRLFSVIEGTLKGQATIVFAEHDAEGAHRLLDRHVIPGTAPWSTRDLGRTSPTRRNWYRCYIGISARGIPGERRSAKENERKRHERDDGRGKGERGEGAGIGNGDAAGRAGRSVEGVLPQLHFREGDIPIERGVSGISLRRSRRRRGGAVR